MGPPGHFAIGFAAKPTAPEVPIWVFLLASWFLDVLSYAFEALGLEKFAVSQTDFVQGSSNLGSWLGTLFTWIGYVDHLVDHFRSGGLHFLSRSPRQCDSGSGGLQPLDFGFDRSPS